MVYYGMEERLLADAERAEAEHARFQKKIDRMKASLVGSPFAIARIILNVLPLGALFLPLAKISLSGVPYVEDALINVNAIKLYEGISSLDFGGLFTMMKSGLLGSAFTMYFAALLALLIPVVLILLQLVRMIMSCSKKSCIKNAVAGGVGAALIAVSAITFNSFAGSINTVFPSIISAKLGVGIFVFLGLYLLIVAVNILLAIKEIPVKYKKIETYADKMAASMKEAQEAKDEERSEAPAEEPVPTA